MEREEIETMIENKVLNHQIKCMEQFEKVIIKTINAEIGKKFIYLFLLVLGQIALNIWSAVGK